MCSLRKSKSLLSVIVSLLGHASRSSAITQEMVLKGDFLHQKVNPTAPGNTSVLDQKVTTVGYKVGKIDDRWDFTLLAIVDDTDNTKIYLHDRRGETISLSDKYGNDPDKSITLKSSYYRGPLTITSTLTRTMNVSARAIRDFSTEALYGLYDGATLLGLNVDYSEVLQPLDYFINSNYKTIQKPLKIVQTRVGFIGEQILGPRMKTRVELFYSDNHHEQPNSWGSTVKVGYALGSRVFSTLTGRMITQRRDQPLLYDRGYLDLVGYEAGVTFEPIYDLLVTISYALQTEREDDPRTSYRKQVHSQQWGVGLDYTQKNFTIGTMAALQTMDDGSTNTQLGVNCTWKI